MTLPNSIGKLDNKLREARFEALLWSISYCTSFDVKKIKFQDYIMAEFLILFESAAQIWSQVVCSNLKSFGMCDISLSKQYETLTKIASA